MKKRLTIYSLVVSAALSIFGCSNANQENQPEQSVAVAQEEVSENSEAQQDTIKKSIPSETVGAIGGSNIKINYHSPGVKGRVIWGGLVPYDQVWVTGAHMATAIEFDKPMLLDGKEIPAGKYALFTIPGRKDWTVILNKDWQQHLADNYDQSKDVVRVKVKPYQLPQHLERLNYSIVPTSGTEGVIRVAWEKIGVSLPVKRKS